MSPCDRVCVFVWVCICRRVCPQCSHVGFWLCVSLKTTLDVNDNLLSAIASLSHLLCCVEQYMKRYRWYMKHAIRLSQVSNGGFMVCTKMTFCLSVAFLAKPEIILRKSLGEKNMIIYYHCHKQSLLLQYLLLLIGVSVPLSNSKFNRQHAWSANCKIPTRSIYFNNFSW